MDYIVRATAAHNSIRVFMASTAELVENARAIHKTSDVATAALGRLLTAGVLMGSMQKNSEDVLTLQVKCGGPIGGITVTSGFFLEDGGRESVYVKGYVNNPDVVLPLNDKGKLDVGGALGPGFLNVIKDMGMKEPFSGQTILVSGEIAEDLTYYFANSEQIPSSVALGVLLNSDGSVKHAGGFIVQLLPFAEDSIAERLEERLGTLPPLTKLLDEGKTPEQILDIIFEDFGLEITDRIKTSFHCNCSRERVQKAIMSIGTNELREMAGEKEPTEVKCHFCNSAYIFTKEDIKEIIRARR